jgi:hypothetical protein
MPREGAALIVTQTKSWGMAVLLIVNVTKPSIFYLGAVSVPNSPGRVLPLKPMVAVT